MSRSSPKSHVPTHRLERVGELIRHAMSEILARGDVLDDALERHPVTVPAVRMSPDLKLATVSVMPLGGLDAAATIDALNRHKKALNGARVLVLGVAYKKDIDDLRESPALTIIELLQKDGAQVSYHDPYFPSIGKGRKYDLQLKCAELSNLGQYDCVVIVTDHSDYDFARIVEEAQLVVDTRNATRGIASSKIVRC